MPSPNRGGELDGLPTDNEFGSAVLHMSVSEIDQYLTAGTAPKQSLWVPPGVSTRGGDRHLEAGEAHRGAAPRPSHGIWPNISDRSGSEKMQHRGHDDTCSHTGCSHGYGATVPLAHPHAPSDDHLFRQHARISRVVTGIASACALVFVIAVCSNPPVTNHGKAGEQELASVEGFGCSGFLCPHSGSCQHDASKCPEGNPFLAATSLYSKLIECGPNVVCTCKSAKDKGPLPCEQTGELMLAGWSSQPAGGCSSILCPRSGVCVTSPHLCAEGDPFANKQGVYYKDAMSAQIVRDAQKERKAVLHAAAAKRALSLQGKGKGNDVQSLAANETHVAKEEHHVKAHTEEEEHHFSR